MLINYIDSKTNYEMCISALEQNDSLAIDLEFDKNMFRYGFNLCLIQIKVKEACYIIDPLSAHVEIKKLFPVLENRAVQKIVFAFGEDLRLLHSLGATPQNMYDLNTAAGLLNFPPLSLTNLIEQVLGVQVRKSAQRSNWCLRPLTQTQLDYAADDVLYLHELKNVFMKMAQDKGITHWIQQEIDLLDTARYHGVESTELYRDKDKQGMTELHWYIFKKLIDYREELAKAANRPAYQVIDKDFLLSLSKDIKNLNNFDKSKSMPSVKTQAVRSKLKQICELALNEGEKIGLSDNKSAFERMGREKFIALRKVHQRIEELKTSVYKPIKQAIALEYGDNAAAFMLSSRTMENIITGNTASIPAYRFELIAAKAKVLNLDLSDRVDTNV